MAKNLSINLNIPSFIYLNIINSTCILYHLKWLNLQIVSIYILFFWVIKKVFTQRAFQEFFFLLFSFWFSVCIWTSIAKKKSAQFFQLSTQKFYHWDTQKSIKRIFLKRKKSFFFAFFLLNIIWTFCGTENLHDWG